MQTARQAKCAPSTAPDPEGLPARVAEALSAAAPDLGDDAPLAVAVSGGGDSLALLHILQFLRPGRIRAVTVDHGLRSESGSEAAHVGRICAALSVPHDVLRWQGWSGQGNLQDAARQARLRLISDWAAKAGVAAVVLGHTLDDQAETVLLRLARGSGVDGLSAISPDIRIAGTRWLRPMLEVRRSELRVYLGDAGIDWVDDPSNENDDFDRVKARAALEELSRIGLTREGLARTAAHQTRARAALNWMTEIALRAVATPSEAGYVRLNAKKLADYPEEIRLRLVAHVLGWVSGRIYPPRFASLTSALAALQKGEVSRSLQGCLLLLRDGDIVVCREPARCGPSVRSGEAWDGRWLTEGGDDLWVAALGEKGLADCPDWRDTGHPREALLSSPAFWRDGTLFAAPFALPQKGCNVELKGGPEGLFAVS